jgi:hypothetical protein
MRVHTETMGRARIVTLLDEPLTAPERALVELLMAVGRPPRRVRGGRSWSVSPSDYREHVAVAIERASDKERESVIPLALDETAKIRLVMQIDRGRLWVVVGGRRERREWTWGYSQSDDAYLRETVAEVVGRLDSSQPWEEGLSRLCETMTDGFSSAQDKSSIEPVFTDYPEVYLLSTKEDDLLVPVHLLRFNYEGVSDYLGLHRVVGCGHWNGDESAPLSSLQSRANPLRVLLVGEAPEFDRGLSLNEQESLGKLIVSQPGAKFECLERRGWGEFVDRVKEFQPHVVHIRCAFQDGTFGRSSDNENHTLERLSHRMGRGSLSKASPRLVFLEMCDGCVPRHESPLGVAGLFRDAGAETVIASLGRVDAMKGAAAFAEEFYSALFLSHSGYDAIRRPSIGEALLAARQRNQECWLEARCKKDKCAPPTWMSFMLYGDPSTVL